MGVGVERPKKHMAKKKHNCFLPVCHQPPQSHPLPQGLFLHVVGDHQKSQRGMKDELKDADKEQILSVRSEMRAGFAVVVFQSNLPKGH